MTYEQVLKAWEEQLLRLPKNVEVQIVEDDGTYRGRKLDEFAGDADALIGLRIEHGMLDETFWKKHPQLKYVGTLSHAYGEFDKELSRRYNVTITNTVYGVSTIAEYTWAFILKLCGKEPLEGKTLGIIGQGAIGKRVAAIGRNFGMEILTWDPVRKRDGLNQLFEKSDIISLNARVVQETREIICKKSLMQMKPGVIIVNTARGALIQEKDLYDALVERKVKAAGLDVFTKEPPDLPEQLMQCPYCKTSGHIAWMTEEAVYRTIAIGMENFLAYLAGKPVSVINQEFEHELEPY